MRAEREAGNGQASRVDVEDVLAGIGEDIKLANVFPFITSFARALKPM